jgi:hypothetical protein
LFPTIILATSPLRQRLEGGLGRIAVKLDLHLIDHLVRQRGEIRPGLSFLFFQPNRPSAPETFASLICLTSSWGLTGHGG